MMSERLRIRKTIEFNNVGFHFLIRKCYFSKEKYWALKNVSFNLYKGESLGIIGRNGAGKTTLLKLLGGIFSPDRGKVINYGVSTSLLSLQTGFIPYLTGRENAFLNGMYLGMKKKQIAEHIEEIHKFSGLGDFFYQPISSYSSGMRARLGFSVAAQLDPDVLLIDEVLGVGDRDFKEKSSKKIHGLLESDKTVVLVSHSPAAIKNLCDRAVLIEDGETVLEGGTEEVLDRYAKM